MAKNKINIKRGFTIIEVVLVLAIAGLIFLMVFIALPALQRSQRDTQRRNDYSSFSAAVSQYQTNNNGKLPANGATLAPKMYLNSTGLDPNGLTYVVKVVDLGTTGSSVTELSAVANSNTATKVYLYVQADCSDVHSSSGADKPKKVNSKRAYAIYGQLESGNGTYCQASNK